MMEAPLSTNDKTSSTDANDGGDLASWAKIAGDTWSKAHDGLSPSVIASDSPNLEPYPGPPSDSSKHNGQKTQSHAQKSKPTVRPLIADSQTM